MLAAVSSGWISGNRWREINKLHLQQMYRRRCKETLITAWGIHTHTYTHTQGTSRPHDSLV